MGEYGGVDDEVLEVDGWGGICLGGAGAGTQECLFEGVQEVAGPGVEPVLDFLQLVIIQAMGGE